MLLEYPQGMTGCERERGAMTFLTAVPTAEHVCVASVQLLSSLQYSNSLVI